jgi:hypothetical protein
MGNADCKQKVPATIVQILPSKNVDDASPNTNSTGGQPNMPEKAGECWCFKKPLLERICILPPEISPELLYVDKKQQKALQAPDAAAGSKLAQAASRVDIQLPEGVLYTDDRGQIVRFDILDGKLLKAVNGAKQCNADDASGIVTRLHWEEKEGWGGIVTDQNGSGGAVPGAAIDTLLILAEKVGVPHNIPNQQQDLDLQLATAVKGKAMQLAEIVQTTMAAREMRLTSAEFDKWDFGDEIRPTLMLARFKALPAAEVLPSTAGGNRHSVGDDTIKSEVKTDRSNRRWHLGFSSPFRCCSSTMKASPFQIGTAGCAAPLRAEPSKSAAAERASANAARLAFARDLLPD